MTDKKALINSMMTKVYREGGRGPIYYDCSGMVIAVCRCMGWPVPDFPVDAMAAAKRAIFKDQKERGEWTSCEPIEGAVAFFGRFSAARHVGIVIDGGILQIAEHPTNKRIVHGRVSWKPLDAFAGKRMEFAQWRG